MTTRRANIAAVFLLAAVVAAVAAMMMEHLRVLDELRDCESHAACS